MQGLGLSLAKSSIVSGVTSDPKWWEGDGVNDYISGDAVTPYIWTDVRNQDLSLSFWVRIDSTTKKNQMFFSLSASDSSNDNSLLCAYDSAFNRIYFRQRFGGSNHHRTFALHDNSSATGITSSSTGWRASNRGRTNDDGFTNITVTYDASSGASGIKIFWNNEQLTTVANTTNLGTQPNWNPLYLGIGDYISATNPTANALGGAINEIKLYNRALSSSEVSDIYNGGGATSASNTGVTSGLITEWRLNDDATDSNGKYTSTNNGGTFT